MGAVLSQLGESKEEVTVAVERILGTDLEMDGNGEVSKLTDESTSLGCQVVVAVVSSQMEDGGIRLVYAGRPAQVFRLPLKSVFCLQFGLDGRHRQGRGHLGSQASDMVFQNLIGRLRHGTVVVTLHLVEGHVRVARELQHAPEVGLFFVAAIEFQFPVT